MTLALDQMHDATLVAIRFEWSTRTCSLDFSGAPHLPEPFTITFTNVAELVVPAGYPWGPSVSVLEVRETGTGRYEFAMQSGDTIAVVAPGNSFKPEPLRGSV